MKLASMQQTEIQLLGVKLPFLYYERFEIQHSGFNSRYQLILDLSSEQEFFPSVLTKLISIQLKQPHSTSYFHGELLSFSQRYLGVGHWSCRIIAGCSLHRLDNYCSHRFFINKNLEEIIRDLLAPHQINASFQLAKQEKSLAYVAQAERSDYDFLLQLCSEHGLSFYYRQEEKGANLYFTCDRYEGKTHRLIYNPGNGLNDKQAFIHHLSRQQLALADQIRLRAYPEDDFSRVWESTTQNQSSIPGLGTLNFMVNHSIESQEACDKQAKLFQEQLDWQRETFCMESTNTTIQVGDLVTISEHPELEKQQTFRAFDLCSSIDRSRNKEHSHPFTQSVYLLPVATPYRKPCQETAFYQQADAQVYIPQGWLPCLVKVQPALQLARIASNEAHADLALDAQGRYPVNFLFDRQEKSPLLRLAQIGAGLPLSTAQGTHLTLAAKTEVVIAHLDNQVNKPFILGTLPTNNQVGPITNQNPELLSIRLRNGSALDFHDQSEDNQRIHLYTQKNQHGLQLEHQGQDDLIHAQSQGEMQLLARNDFHLSSQNLNLSHDQFLFQAEDEFILKAKKNLNLNSGEALQYSSGNDWQAHIQSETLDCQAKESLHLDSAQISLQAKQLNLQSPRTSMHSGQSLTVQANQALAMQTGETKLLFSEGSIQFKAQKITIEAQTIQKNQGGMANST